MIITIDGPVGSGKTTVAELLAQRLGMHYINTGLLYRAVAKILLHYLQKKITDFPSISVKDLSFVNNITYDFRDGEGRVCYEGNDITVDLLGESLAQAASMISENPHVRQALLPIQRRVAVTYDVIADGRDCGSVVFPFADYKFYLTASLNQRAKRLLRDKKRKFHAISIEEIKTQIEERDERDRSRRVAPLRIPEGAIVIDNSTMTIEETIELFLQHLEGKP